MFGSSGNGYFNFNNPWTNQQIQNQEANPYQFQAPQTYNFGLQNRLIPPTHQVPLMQPRQRNFNNTSERFNFPENNFFPNLTNTNTANSSNNSNKINFRKRHPKFSTPHKKVDPCVKFVERFISAIDTVRHVNFKNFENDIRWKNFLNKYVYSIKGFNSCNEHTTSYLLENYIDCIKSKIQNTSTDHTIMIMFLWAEILICPQVPRTDYARYKTSLDSFQQIFISTYEKVSQESQLAMWNMPEHFEKRGLPTDIFIKLIGLLPPPLPPLPPPISQDTDAKPIIINSQSQSVASSDQASLENELVLKYEEINFKEKMKSAQRNNFNQTRFHDFKSETKILIGTNEMDYLSQKQSMQNLVSIFRKYSSNVDASDFIYCLLTTTPLHSNGIYAYRGKLILWAVSEIIIQMPDALLVFKNCPQEILESLTFLFKVVLNHTVKRAQTELAFKEFVAIRQRLSVGFSKDQLEDIDKLVSFYVKKNYWKYLGAELNWIDCVKNIPWKFHKHFRYTKTTNNSQKSVELDNISQQANVQSIQEENLNSSSFTDFEKEIQVLLKIKEDDYISQQNSMKKLVTIVLKIPKIPIYDFVTSLLKKPFQDYSEGCSYHGRLILWTVCDVLSAVTDLSTTKKCSHGISYTLASVFKLAMFESFIDKSVTLKNELLIQELVAIRQRLSLGFSNLHLENLDKIVASYLKTHTSLNLNWADCVKNNPLKSFIHFRATDADSQKLPPISGSARIKTMLEENELVLKYKIENFETKMKSAQNSNFDRISFNDFKSEIKVLIGTNEMDYPSQEQSMQNLVAIFRKYSSNVNASDFIYCLLMTTPLHSNGIYDYRGKLILWTVCEIIIQIPDALQVLKNCPQEILESLTFLFNVVMQQTVQRVQTELAFREFVAIRKGLSLGFSKDQLEDIDKLVFVYVRTHYSKFLPELNWIYSVKNLLPKWKCHKDFRSSESTNNFQKSAKFDNISQKLNLQSIEEEKFNSSRFTDFKKEIQVLLGTKKDDYVSQQNSMKKLVTIVKKIQNLEVYFSTTIYDFVHCLLSTPFQDYSGGSNYCGRLILWTVCDILSAITDSFTDKKCSSDEIFYSMINIFKQTIFQAVKDCKVKTKLLIQEFVAIRQRLSLGFSNVHLEKLDNTVAFLINYDLNLNWAYYVKNNPWKNFIHFRTTAVDNVNLNNSQKEVQILDDQIQPDLMFNQSDFSNDQNRNSEINIASQDPTTPALIKQTILDNSPIDNVNKLSSNSVILSNIKENTSKSNPLNKSEIPTKVKALFKKCAVCGTDFYDSSQTATQIISKPSLDLNNHSCMNVISEILGKNWYSESKPDHNCVSNCKAKSKNAKSQPLQLCPNCKLIQEKAKSPYTIQPSQKNSVSKFQNIPKADLPHTSCTEPTTNSWGASSIPSKSSIEPNSNINVNHILILNSNDSDISNVLPINNEIIQYSETETNILQSDEPAVFHSPDCECMCQSLLEELLNSHSKLPSLDVKKTADAWLKELQEIKI